MTPAKPGVSPRRRSPVSACPGELRRSFVGARDRVPRNQSRGELKCPVDRSPPTGTLGNPPTRGRGHETEVSGEGLSTTRVSGVRGATARRTPSIISLRKGWGTLWWPRGPRSHPKGKPTSQGAPWSLPNVLSSRTVAAGQRCPAGRGFRAGARSTRQAGRPYEDPRVPVCHGATEPVANKKNLVLQRLRRPAVRHVAPCSRRPAVCQTSAPNPNPRQIMNRISTGFPEATASRAKGDLFNDFLLT
jgi:hypothetical protein